MRDVTTELKELRLHGMAGAWAELTTHEGRQTDVGVQTSRWLIEHLLQAEHAQRAFAGSVACAEAEVGTARPIRSARDLARFLQPQERYSNR